MTPHDLPSIRGQLDKWWEVSARGFPSVACDAPLAWFADAACVPPHIDQAASRLLRRRALLRGATVSAVTRYRK